MLGSLTHIDPSKLDASAEVRSVVVYLLNVLESQHAEISTLKAEVLALSNELRRLKGGNAVPEFGPKKATNHSSGGREHGDPKKKSGKRRGRYPKLR